MRSFVFLISLFFLLLGCTGLFYQPNSISYYAASEQSFLDIEEIEFPSLDATMLHGWILRTKIRPIRGLVLQFHGNAENLTSHFQSMTWLLNYGYDVFTFDYRGYGKSKGLPYPDGILLDALAAIEKSRTFNRAETEKWLVLYGQSLGGAIALDAERNLQDRSILRAMIAESSFLSYKSVASEVLSRHFLTWPFQFLGHLLVSDEHSAKDTLSKRHPVPLLVLHGLGDRVVSVSQGLSIFLKAKEPRCLWLLDTDRHAHLMNLNQGKYRERLLKFIDSGECPGKLANFPQKISRIPQNQDKENPP